MAPGGRYRSDVTWRLRHRHLTYTGTGVRGQCQAGLALRCPHLWAGTGKPSLHPYKVSELVVRVSAPLRCLFPVPEAGWRVDLLTRW